MRSFPPVDRAHDSLNADLIPSVAHGNRSDRVLAELDQDGFLFAVEAMDATFFERRAEKVPRKRNRVEICLRNGNVVLRKTFLRADAAKWHAQIWEQVSLRFYVEAAALLRLRAARFVPSVRLVDVKDRLIEVDYIHGTNLRHILARHHKYIFDADVQGTSWSALTDEQRVAREFHCWNSTALDHPVDTAALKQIERDLIRAGVVHQDDHLANFVQSCSSERLYLVDFEFVWLRPAPGRRYAKGLRLL